MRERGQALTLEGSIAAVLLVMSLMFALQVSAVTPLTESTSSQHIENQQKELGQDVLATAAEDGTLKSTVLFWDDGYVGASEEAEGAYANGIPDDEAHHDSINARDHRDVLEFGELLADTFSDRGIAYNIRVNYVEDGERNSRQLVDQGKPSNHAVTVTQMITLYEDDTLYSDGETELSGETFYIEHENEDSSVYNVVEVELVIWRM